MCRTCGCSDEAQPMITDLQTGESSPLDARQIHYPEGLPREELREDRLFQGSASTAPSIAFSATEMRRSGRTIRLDHHVLAKNDSLAESNRIHLGQRGIAALNFISSPGAGKTTLLVRTIKDLEGQIPISVIEGDQATLNDARRIRAAGCKVIQINTGAGCHLDSQMTALGLEQLKPLAHSLVFIENVGNLVCPALFDLGERAKVVVASVTEGEDKPLKYPHAFRAASVLVLNKIDLLPHLTFDMDQFLTGVRQVNPSLRVFQVSATKGDGLDGWYDWLRSQRMRPTWVQTVRA